MSLVAAIGIRIDEKSDEKSTGSGRPKINGSESSFLISRISGVNSGLPDVRIIYIYYIYYVLGVKNQNTGVKIEERRRKRIKVLCPYHMEFLSTS